MRAGGDSSSPHIGDPTAIQAGKESYQLVCSGCHGVTGEGGRGPNLVTAPGIQKASDQELFGVIKGGIPGSDMPPSPLDEEKIWQLAGYVRSLSAPAIRQNAPGDREAGRMLFYGEAGCTNCHMIRGEGGYLGPDLTNLGVTAQSGADSRSPTRPQQAFRQGIRSGYRDPSLTGLESKGSPRTIPTTRCRFSTARAGCISSPTMTQRQLSFSTIRGCLPTILGQAQQRRNPRHPCVSQPPQPEFRPNSVQ